MIKIKHLIAGLITLSSTTICMADANVNKFGFDTKISDLALVYAGDSRRPEWTMDDLTPYVTHRFANGSEKWFFDGFLFLEYENGDVAFGNGNSTKEPAMQSDWQWLLDEYFTSNRKLDALDKLIEKKKATLGQPTLRHKVVITCCAPVKAESGNWSRIVWGTVNGSELRFVSRDNRVTAVKWYIDLALEKWKAANFKNIDLEGFYWIEEGLYTNGDIITEINDYIHSKGLRSYWIPYYTDNKLYYSKWSDEYKFDMAYLQPNYAFLDANGDRKPKSLLTNAVDEAKSYGMGLELEFETQERSNALHSVNPLLHQHILDYMDVFDQKGVIESAGIAYYTGTQGLIHMDKSSDPVDHMTIDRIANYVIKRQNARAASAAISEIEADETALAYVRDGKIITTDEAACYDISGRLIFQGLGEVTCQPGIYVVRDKNGNSVKLLVK